MLSNWVFGVDGNIRLQIFSVSHVKVTGEFDHFLIEQVNLKKNEEK
jgi:hypothetical protein